MPYSSNDQLPPGLKELPEEAKTIFRKAFNAALGEYKDEVTARKVAWAAVKGSFKKDDSGKWIKKIKAFLSLQCLKLSSLSSDDILALVDPQTISRIKAMDAHPFFQAYSICHEGVSQPTILGEKSKPIHWTRAAVESIKNVVRKGIKFFRGHNKDNATEGREALGEIVADTQKEIDGKLHHVVIGYFPDKAKVADADVCSQEADWNLIDYAGKCIADTMRKLTGIALSNSSVDKPAFEGAVRLGMVQAFTADEGDKNNRAGDAKMDLSTVSFSELAGEVKRRNTFPHQLFSLDEIKKDKEIIPLVDELDKLRKETKEQDKKLKDSEAEKTVLSKRIESVTAKDKLSKILVENKLVPVTDKQRGFIEKRFKGIDDTSDEAIKKYIESEIVEFKSFVELVGAPKDDAKSNDKLPDDKKDMTKAANNPLLEEDFNS